MEGYIASIILFAGNFAPRGWALCQGQILSIAQNTALFALLGTTYGGNGQTTFGLPDLRGRAPVQPGQGPGLSNIELGEVGGVEQISLLASQLPAHNHTVFGSSAASSKNPNGAVPGFSAGGSIYGTTLDTPMNAAMVSGGGSNVPISIRDPYLGLNYIICLEGDFPSRN